MESYYSTSTLSKSVGFCVVRNPLEVFDALVDVVVEPLGSWLIGTNAG